MVDREQSPDNQVREPSDLFEGDDALPFEKQQRVHRFITQETRYAIIQAILGHPHHLATLDELEYLVPKNRSTICEHLDHLVAKHIVVQQSYEGDDSGRAVPHNFWGFTGYGITLLDQYNFLRYVPVLRALQDGLSLTEKLERHRNAPRPALPDDISEAFKTPPSKVDVQAKEKIIATHELGDDHLLERPENLNSDGPPGAGEDHPLDELFR